MDQAAQQLDLQMRASALQLAVQAVSKDNMIGPEDIIPMAHAFYKFLKGE